MDPNHLPARAADRGRDPARPFDQASPTRPTAGDPALSIFEVLLKHKLAVIACTLLGLGLGALYLYLAPPFYRTQAEVYVEPTEAGRPNSPLSPRGVSAGLPSTHAALMISTPVLEAALQNPAVADSTLLAGSLDRVKRLRDALEVDSSQEAETVTIALTGNDPDEIAAVVNAVLQAYLTLQQPWLAAQSAAGGLSPLGGGGIMSDELTAARLSELSNQLTAAEVGASAAAARLAQGRQADGDVALLTQLVQQSGLTTDNIGLAELGYLRYERARVKMALDSLSDTFGPDHQQRKPIEREYRAVEREMRAFEESTGAAMLGMLSETHRQAQERRDELAAGLRSERSAAEADAELPVRVIEEARVPQVKAGPRKGRTLAIALVLGFVAGSLLAIGLELRQRDPSGATDADADALDPAADAPAADASAGEAPPNTLPARAGAAVAAPAFPVLGVVPEIPLGRRLASPDFDASASSIHQVRAVLQVHARQHGHAAYAFTSPRRGAGKTSVTIGVATSLALSGTRTLVVDCDLAGRIARGQRGRPAPAADPYGPISPDGSPSRGDSLDDIAVDQGYLADDDSRAVAAPADPAPGHDAPRLGVTGMLDGGTLDECAIAATVEGLSLLPAVAAETRHIGRMSDAFVRRVVEESRGRFDLVLFDTGPIPGSTEALLVTSQVDGVVLVVPEGEDPAALDRTLSYLKVVDATIVGTVFNRSVAAATAPANPRHNPAPAAEPVDLMVRDDDDAMLDADRALGSGILAAAVFSDADSGYANDRWTLATSGTDDVDDTPGHDAGSGPATDANPDADPGAAVPAVEALADRDDVSVFTGSVDELFARAGGSDDDGDATDLNGDGHHHG